MPLGRLPGKHVKHTMKSSTEKSFLKKWASIRLAHEAVMLEDVREVLKNDRKATKAHRRKMLEIEDAIEDIQEPEDMIHIGDIIDRRTGREGKPSSTLTKFTLAAALFASGAGLGVAVPLVTSALWPSQTHEKPAASEPLDKDTLYQLKLLPEN